MNQSPIIGYVEHLLTCSPRQGEGEQRAAEVIEAYIRRFGLQYSAQEFTSIVPHTIEASLIADGKSFRCDGSSLSGGSYEGEPLFTDTSGSDKPTISFNVASQTGITLRYTQHPSVSIRKDDADIVRNARHVEIKIAVEPKKHTSRNILVGNQKDPSKIVFTHYDSIKSGAVDNASGIAVCLDIIKRQRQLLEQTLVCICGAEELSYDEPYYWGHGYREFEKSNADLLDKAEQIILIDSVGNGGTNSTKDPDLLRLGIPLKQFEKYVFEQRKVMGIIGDMNHLLSVYHSEADDISCLSEWYLQDATDVLGSYLR